MNKPDGTSCYINDCFYPVYDSKSGGIIAYAGVAKKISNPKQVKLTQLLERIALIKQAVNILTFRSDGNNLQILAILSNREIQCMIGLLQWKTAKQIAKTLQVSPKTVESYIDSAKMKLNCYTKPELIEKLIYLTESFL